MLLEKDGVRWEITDGVILSAFLKSGWIEVKEDNEDKAEKATKRTAKDK